MFFFFYWRREDEKGKLYKISMSWCSKFFRRSNTISAGYQSLYTTNEKKIIDIGLQKHCGEKTLCSGMVEMRGKTLGRNVFRTGFLHLDLYRGNFSLFPNALFGPKTEQRPNLFWIPSSSDHPAFPGSFLPSLEAFWEISQFFARIFKFPLVNLDGSLPKVLKKHK